MRSRGIPLGGSSAHGSRIVGGKLLSAGDAGQAGALPWAGVWGGGGGCRWPGKPWIVSAGPLSARNI